MSRVRVQKIFITQSAMSNVLKQLRDIFSDELLTMTEEHATHFTGTEITATDKNLLQQAENIFEQKHLTRDLRAKIYFGHGR